MSRITSICTRLSASYCWLIVAHHDHLRRLLSTVVLRYSHVLKTDDDCYVRVSKLVNLVKKLARDGDSMMYAGRQVRIQIA